MTFRLSALLLFICVSLFPQAKLPPAKTPAAHTAASTPPGITARRVVPTADRQKFEISDKIAVVVAVGNYPASDGLPTLRYPLADAIELTEELRRQQYQVFQLLNNEATADNVRDQLRKVSQGIEKGKGTLIFFFTGHGFQSKNKNYLATYGTNMSNLEALGLPFDDVKDLMAASGALRRVAFVDACRNDPNAKAAVSSFRDLQASEGFRALLSTRPGGFSYEDSSLQHGIYTHFLLTGLRGAAQGPDGLITFDDLRNYVTTSVFKYASERNLIQKPFELAEDGSGDFLIATAPKATTEQIAASKPAEPPPANMLVLHNLDDHGRYIVNMDDQQLKLYRLPAKEPFAILARTPTKNSSVLYYSGAASGNARLDVVATRGPANEVTAIDGRLGTARPPNDMESGWMPLFEEEKHQVQGTSGNVKERADQIGNAIGSVFGGRARRSRDATTKVGNSADAANKMAKTPDQRNFTWRRFKLTTELAPAK